MTEIERVREAVYRKLVGYGYDPERTREQVNTYVEVVEYFRGRPAVVRTENGNLIYL